MITTSDFCKKEYGEKLYKLSLSGRFTCPNRDGRIGYGGCIFCSEGGSGDFAESAELSIEEQIERAKAKVSAKFKGNRYIAYFQAFSNTYAPVDYLRSLYDPLTKRDDIAVISIATRPDCLNDEIYCYLDELNRKKPVWVELGLQTVKDESIKYIRRGYPTKIYDEAIKRLNGIGVHTITHIILGLPGETLADMQNTLKHVISVGSRGIKLQLLHVLKGTDLAADYAAGKFSVLSEDEYMNILEVLLKDIPEDMVVHRLTGDGPKKLLIAPLWSGNKREVMNRLNKIIGRT